MRRTALVIRVPEAESIVGPWRRRLASDARYGVPAHFTVLFPFVPADDIDDDTRSTLSAALKPLSPFEIVLTTTSWFGEEVLWLAPERDEGIRAVVGAVERAFPALRPYGGAYDETIPHLTVGDDKPYDLLVEADRDVQRSLPIASRVDAVTMLAEESDGTWRVADVFDLGKTADPSPP